MSDLLRILIAPLVWLAAFSAVYGLQAVLCAHAATSARPVLMAAFGVAVLVQVALLAALCAPRFAAGSAFVRFVSRAAGWTGLVATVWTLLPVVAAPLCI